MCCALSPGSRADRRLWEHPLWSLALILSVSLVNCGCLILSVIVCQRKASGIKMRLRPGRNEGEWTYVRWLRGVIISRPLSISRSLLLDSFFWCQVLKFTHLSFFVISFSLFFFSRPVPLSSVGSIWSESLLSKSKAIKIYKCSEERKEVYKGLWILKCFCHMVLITVFNWITNVLGLSFFPAVLSLYF